MHRCIIRALYCRRCQETWAEREQHCVCNIHFMRSGSGCLPAIRGKGVPGTGEPQHKHRSRFSGGSRAVHHNPAQPGRPLSCSHISPCICRSFFMGYPRYRRAKHQHGQGIDFASRPMPPELGKSSAREDRHFPVRYPLGHGRQALDCSHLFFFGQGARMTAPDLKTAPVFLTISFIFSSCQSFALVFFL